MKKDYYESLNITRNSNEEQVSTAYKKLALKFHPLKNPDHMNTYLSKFHTICEAYEVLSNQQTKTIYDQYGADVLLQGTKGPDGVYRGGYTYQ
mmetsp:Transcript_24692/g.17385  ORF Transcript_24692/g.17385 Transcript_24692/m.17385 type:complete len:93 (+) Transcript_24692:24-302(+)|eukprot:CAMPEP_0116876884 /NCGR_PEP_ID=MMETSP0463-20121206/8745_1 /TAXON_ID=181622 /ORGANISM="Strombidinopsis sp, Strain SopsisLIS2011" /LENGTH=92 /DNA_ID=CAMNT_0004523773 /DNA_START=16 /DNA_END=294 /DNA_ORIENTATION=+